MPQNRGRTDSNETSSNSMYFLGIAIGGELKNLGCLCWRLCDFFFLARRPNARFIIFIHAIAISREGRARGNQQRSQCIAEGRERSLKKYFLSVTSLILTDPFLRTNPRSFPLVFWLTTYSTPIRRHVCSAGTRA